MRRIMLAMVGPVALAACGETEDTANEQAAASEANAPGEETAGEPAPPVSDQTSGAASLAAASKLDEASAGASLARCAITAVVPGTHYEGPCQFESFGGASFGVSTDNPAGFVDGHTEILLEADTPSAAGMSVRTSDGELAYVGPAAREGACWINDSYELCAYAE